MNRLCEVLEAVRNWISLHPIALAAGVALSSFFVALARIPPSARGTLWAEDGRNFIQAATIQGPIFSLFSPYSGYLHTVPRIIAAAIVEWVAVPQYAVAMTGATCAVAGLAAGVVFLCTREVVDWIPARLVIAGVTVLAPLEPREVLGNAANLHSILFWMLFWMLLYRPHGRRGSVALGAIALCAALTEIQSLFLLPLLLFGLRDRRRWPLRAGYLLGAAIQFVVTLAWPRGTNGNPAPGLPSIAYGYVINSVVPLWIPQTSIGPALANFGVVLAVVLVLPIVLATVVVIKRGTGAQRVAVCCLLIGSGIVYAAAVVDNPDSRYDYSTFDRAHLVTLWLSRYGVVPSMMLIAVIVIGVTALRGARSTARLPPQAVGAIVAIMSVVVLLGFQLTPQDTRRSAGPLWYPQVKPAAEKCETLPDSHTIYLSETIGWKVALDCRVLEKYE